MTTENVEGVMLLDPSCMVHKARDFKSWSGGRHDRPQRIVDFLSTAAIDSDARPLFGLLTCKRARSVGTAQIASVYCLDGWQFLDGASIRINHTS